eukprot:4029881-Pyramimonas_sp.AAC.1
MLRACRAYSEAAGLGWDGCHPRWVLQLPEDYQLRLLDIIRDFDNDPVVIDELLSALVFLPKPEGGVRPIGLLCLVTT